MEERVLRSERIYEGRIVNLRIDTVRLPRGRESTPRSSSTATP
ncbi:MAG TPA: hypothetical protein VFZ12_06535 [Dehalococcoidia bacterium]|nr:hypothetical protein [Dehalococcoidia bacterium]